MGGVSREQLATHRPIWLITGAMYGLFAALSAAASLLDGTEHPARVWGLAVWLAAAAALHLTREAPRIDDPINHASLACVSLTVAAAFVVTQPSGGLAVGGAMFIAPLVSIRLTSRRLIATHVLFACALLLGVSASGVFASVVNLTTVFCAGLLGLALPALAVSCTAVLEAAEAQGRELERVVRRDPLTGVGNRRLLEEQLEREAARHLRVGGELGLVAIELDGFSALHHEDPYDADRVLREVAEELTASVKPGCTVARLDDGEFVVLLPDTSALQARNHATAAQRIIAAMPRGDRPALTALVGWATLPDDTTATSVLLDVADARRRNPRQTRSSCATPAQEERRRSCSS